MRPAPQKSSQIYAYGWRGKKNASSDWGTPKSVWLRSTVVKRRYFTGDLSVLYA